MKTPTTVLSHLAHSKAVPSRPGFTELCQRAVRSGPILASRLGPGPTAMQRRAKRTFDITCSLTGLILAAPLLALVALAVKLTSPGPVFFRHVRVGYRGKPFTMLKFRTMRTGAPRQVDTDGRTLVREGDVRLTPVGNLLRRGLDELPQLVNVLRGEMALVGPRPDEPYHLAYYEEGWHHRLTVRPGITGLPQVAGRRALPWAERVALDNAYISCLSLRLDAQVLLRTVSAIWSNEGNA